jgi:glycogen(starch) synthase
LRIVLYTHDWAPLVGGVQTICTALAKGLSACSTNHAGERMEVTLVTQTPAEGMDDSSFPFAVVRRPGLRRLIDLIRSADLLHIAGPAILPLGIGCVLRKPTLLEHHGYQSICPNGLLVYGPDQSVCPGHYMAGRYEKCIRCNSGIEGPAKSVRSLASTFVRRWLARKVSLNVAPSRHIAGRVALPRTRVIYHGVPAPPRTEGTNSSSHDGPPACFAYVGRLVTEKGLPVLLRATRLLSQAGYGLRLKIVGDGPERSDLEKLTAELGIGSITAFAGSLPPEAIPEVLAHATAVVIPSVWEDVAPLVAIEQMMQGRLVIASDIGGLGETVDGAGLKFAPGDDHALAGCMRQVIESPGLVSVIGEKARRHALKAFTEERMVEEHVQAYQEILGSWVREKLPREGLC